VADQAAEIFLLERKNDLLKQLISVMNTTPKLDNILRYILDLINMTTTAEASIMVTKEVVEGDNLTVKAVSGLKKSIVGKEWPMEKGLISEAYTTGMEKIANSPSSEPGYSPDFGTFINESVNSMMIIPMNAEEGGIIGAVAVLNKKDGLSFTDEDMEMSKILVEQAANLTGQAAALRSIEAKIHRFNTLLAVSKEITQQNDLHKLLQLIMESAKKVMRADASSLFLLDEKAKELYIETAQGEAGEKIKTIRLPVGKGIAGWVAQKGKPELVKDAYEDSRFNPEYDRKTGYRTKSIICVPLEYKKKTIGVVQIINALDKEFFDEEDVDYMIALAGMSATAIENARLLQSNKELFLNVVMALVKVIDSRYKFFTGHSIRTATYAVITASTLGLPASEVEKVQITGFLHDIGRLQMPEKVLLKPGPLNEQEMKYMKMQPVAGAKILQGIKLLDYAVPAILYQMEQYNGKGYPKGIQGEQIPLISRIVGLCSAFDAMCSPRPYRKPMDPKSVRGKISSMAGSQFDPLVVKAFLKAFDEGKIKR